MAVHTKSVKFVMHLQRYFMFLKMSEKNFCQVESSPSIIIEYTGLLATSNKLA